MPVRNRIATNPNVYAVESELNMLELNPAYPSQPKTFGERLRKARMDKNMLIRELAQLIGVTEDTVINWELRGIRPHKTSLSRIESFLEV